ncbi:MAG: putative metalloprotease CJM1_0395 family protein [Polyangiales bacterium]
MVSPIRQHADRLEQRELAAERRRAALPTAAKEEARGATGGADAAHGDAGHRRLGAAERSEIAHDIAKDVMGPGAGKEEEGQELSADEAAKIDKLRKRDAEVRRHEMAHASAGGAHAGAPNYDLERGPDGSMYAVGGHVRIDVSPVAGDPAATLRKMQQVRRAALAPAEPSPQDRRVASRAAAEEAKARTALREEQVQEARAQRESPPIPQEGEEGEVALATPEKREPLAASGRGGFSIMTLHAERAYRRSDPPPR